MLAKSNLLLVLNKPNKLSFDLIPLLIGDLVIGTICFAEPSVLLMNPISQKSYNVSYEALKLCLQETIMEPNRFS